MLGAIIGDLCGSVYEFEQFTTKVCPVEMQNIIEKNAFFSDDTILTIAIADAILSGLSYEQKLKEYGLKYNNSVPKNIPYFKTMFSPNFSNWLTENKQGNSFGNGAMMRISPVGMFFETEQDVIKNTLLATTPSHNNKSSIECATAVALAIFYAKKGFNKQEICEKLKLKIKKPKLTHFNYSCNDTFDLCFYSVLTANSFEEALKIALSFGGDTDTNACIVGSIAEPLFGISNELKQQALGKIPNNFKTIVNSFYQKLKP